MINAQVTSFFIEKVIIWFLTTWGQDFPNAILLEPGLANMEQGQCDCTLVIQTQHVHEGNYCRLLGHIHPL